VVIERLERQPSAAVTGHVGWSFSLHSTSLGKELLAYLPPETVHEWLSGTPLPQFTPTTIADLPALFDELARIRSEGCAYNIGEARPSAMAVAAPVYNHLGHVVAAINAAGSAPAITIAHLRGPVRQAVLDEAAALSRDLGFRDPSLA
jgi:DNA-binding IclR family transcriptional regulator